MALKIKLIILPCLLLTATPLLSATTKTKKTTHAKKQRMQHPYPKKLIKDMNEQELVETLRYAKYTNDSHFIFKVFHALLAQSPNQNNLKNYKIDLADYCFSIKDYEKAVFTYEEFTSLYPGSQEAEYAQYKAIICSFFLCLEPSRDQSITDKTIFMIEEFLKKAQNEEFIKEVKQIFTQCRQKLFEHEVHIFEHYLKQKKFSSTQKRYEYIEEKFQDIKHIEQYLKYMKNMETMVKDPKRCPFIIKFNLKDALNNKIQVTPEKKAKTALYFLA